MKEEWKAIPGHEGEHEVSSFGNVRRLPRVSAKNGYKSANGFTSSKIGGPIKLTPLRLGHLAFTLCGKSVRVNNVVMQAFVGPKPEGCLVTHVDGNVANNHLANLSYRKTEKTLKQLEEKSK